MLRTQSADREGLFFAGDSLRGGACAIVVLCHVYLGLAVRQPQYEWNHAALVYEVGAACIFSFFILSGYLVGGPFARRFVAGREMQPLRVYAEKRLRRVLPAFWVLLTVLILWFGTLGATKGQLAATYLFQQNFFPNAVSLSYMQQAWTLDIEVAFYVALPIMFWFAHRVWGGRGTPERRRTWLLIFLASTFVISFLLHQEHPAANSTTTTLLTFWWPVAPGIALAILEEPGRRWLAGTQRGRRLGLAAMAGGALLLLAVMIKQPEPTGIKTFAAELVAASGILGGAMVWQWATGRVPWPFGARWLHALGRWSLSIYLIHIGIGRELFDHLPDGLGQWGSFAFMGAGMLGGSIVVGGLMWWLVEEPILNKHRPRWPPRATRTREEPAATLP
ncbi:MAG TPA: acyltransferase [Solirubrobacteraceae bacterium]